MKFDLGLCNISIFPLKSPPSGIGGNTQVAETQIVTIETVAGTIKFQFFMANRYFDNHWYKSLTDTAQKLAKSSSTRRITSCREHIHFT